MWEQVAYYGQWLDRWGLTPAQVDELPYWFSQRAPAYWGLVEEVRAEKRRGG